MSRADRQRPAPRHRVAGVDGEVHHDLLDLARAGEFGLSILAVPFSGENPPPKTGDPRFSEQNCAPPAGKGDSPLFRGLPRRCYLAMALLVKGGLASLYWMIFVRGREATLYRGSAAVARVLDLPWGEEDPDHWRRAADAGGGQELTGSPGSASQASTASPGTRGSATTGTFALGGVERLNELARAPSGALLCVAPGGRRAGGRSTATFPP